MGRGLHSARDFWLAASPLSKVCLVLCLLSAALSFYSWLPVPSHDYVFLLMVPLHFAVMALLFAVYFLSVRNSLRVLRDGLNIFKRANLPPTYWRVLAGTVVYLLLVFGWAIIRHWPDEEMATSLELRMWSVVTLFLALVSLPYTQGLRRLGA